MTSLDILITKFQEMKKSLADDLEKGIKDPAMKDHMMQDAWKAHRNQLVTKPTLPASHPQSMPSPEEHAARASMYAEFMNPVKKGDVNESEQLEMSENGQWNIKKAKK